MCGKMAEIQLHVRAMDESERAEKERGDIVQQNTCWNNRTTLVDEVCLYQEYVHTYKIPTLTLYRVQPWRF